MFKKDNHFCVASVPAGGGSDVGLRTQGGAHAAAPQALSDREL